MAVVTHGGCHYPVHFYPCVAGHETAQSMRRFDTSKLGLRKMKVLAILRAPEMRALEGGQLILHDYGRSPLSRAVGALS